MFLPILWLCALVFSAIWGTPIPPKNYLNDYAWRDYEGIIPDDAFKGGQDRLAKPIYIGQTLYENKLISGKIYENDPNIYFEWKNKEYAQHRNVKILCSQSPNKFQWIPTESDKVVLLTNKILIRGGFEADDYTSYLGRVLIDSETLVGKIMCTAENCLGMYTSSNGVAKNVQKFEILTYSPSAEEMIDRLNE